MFAAADLSEDRFLGGRVSILQPRKGYRAATDPVLLAAAVPAEAGEAVLELGCGAGVAALCLGRRVAGLTLTGIERQADYADLARRNAGRNGIALDVVEGDIATMPAGLRARSFDHVMMNPPYFGPGTAAADPGREAALREATPLAQWLDAGLRRLRPGGHLTAIHLAERLPDLLAACGPRLGSLTLLPLAPRAGRPASRILVQGRKGGRGAFCLMPPLILHDGASHGGDGDDFSAAATAILREGAALTLRRR